MCSNMTRIRYSLGLCFFVTTLVCAFFAIAKLIGFELTFEFSKIFFSCAFTCFLGIALYPIDKLLSRLFVNGSILFIPAFYTFLSFSFYLFGDLIDQPPLSRSLIDRLTAVTYNFRDFIPFCTLASISLLLVGRIAQGERSCELTYYPRIWHVWKNLSSVQARLILVAGLSLLFAYFSLTVIQVRVAGQFRLGTVFPPMRIFIICHATWAILWLTDVARSRSCGTLAAITGYFFIIVLMLITSGFTVMRE